MIVTVVIFYFLYENVISDWLLEDDTDDEDHSNQQSELWIWKEETNESKIWNYTKIPGIKVATLSQLGENKKEWNKSNNEQ